MAFFAKLNTSGNVLLLKDDVGKPKPSSRNLPPPDWSYGLPDKKDKEVTNIWQEHRRTAEMTPDRDFKKLNRMSLGQRCTSAKAQREYRKHNDAHIPQYTGKQPRYLAPPSSQPYGVPSLRSDPMSLVLNNTYANLAEEDISNLYSTRFSAPKNEKVRASFSRSQTKQKPADVQTTKEPFKMKRFRQVGARTNTNRTPGQEQSQVS